MYYVIFFICFYKSVLIFFFLNLYIEHQIDCPPVSIVSMYQMCYSKYMNEFNSIHLLTGYESNNTFIVHKVPTIFGGNGEEKSWSRGDNKREIWLLTLPPGWGIAIVYLSSAVSVIYLTQWKSPRTCITSFNLNQWDEWFRKVRERRLLKLPMGE
jgi:hypothetical protein